MGRAVPARPVQLVMAMFSRYPDLLDDVVRRLQGEYGPVLARSARWRFDQTRYYEPTMGADLVKELVAFERLVDPAEIVPIKLATNSLEAAVAAEGRYPEPRPVNVDPGYLSAGKFVLATTKDYTHRLYLGQGIYAEVTLYYADGRFQPWPWTYPDFRSEEYRAFLKEVRQVYLSKLNEAGGRPQPDVAGR